ncbi:hypothetical protein ERO13_A08G058800v2 [Gossypium hirsutum]|uniref:Non-specific lipid-transfer protein n=1 Tax=Gossypium hirsutum TaxID=3635 RepID=A0A1U8NYZ0_GOSHI|nr:non-specific lipid-transfer protein A-like [Gossypium hirsutum]KAG4186683.1 hypothetical protein ERO13_A08G058800v2 [Gossypium hirsutum]
MKGVVISVLVVLAMVRLMVRLGEATISCEEVVNIVRPCAPYIMTGIGSSTIACCNGLDQLRKSATTTADKQQACQCAKDAAAGFLMLNEQVSASLPTLCKRHIDFPISKNINCQDIH